MTVSSFARRKKINPLRTWKKTVPTYIIKKDKLSPLMLTKKMTSILKNLSRIKLGSMETAKILPVHLWMAKKPLFLKRSQIRHFRLVMSQLVAIKL